MGPTGSTIGDGDLPRVLVTATAPARLDLPTASPRVSGTGTGLGPGRVLDRVTGTGLGPAAVFVLVGPVREVAAAAQEEGVAAEVELRVPAAAAARTLLGMETAMADVAIYIYIYIYVLL
ncbi:unnamed protein product [Linum tenue]|uniref:Uncharacterized protein n=1 Tax=Linum tenue TaxID=586396 RepID=A0AAV0MSF3_9ROSI|nr:unnamed protein product [Linum tenue]